MKILVVTTIFFSIIATLVWGSTLLAQEGKSDQDNAAIDEKTKNKFQRWQPKPQKKFGKKRKKAECRKYEGKYIGYYGRVFKVKSCTRHEIRDYELVRRMLKTQPRVIPVSNDTIIMLKEGKPLDSLHSSSLKPVKICKKYEGKYVIAAGSDIHLIEACKKRRFPDWETYIWHKKKRKEHQAKIYEITIDDYYSFQDGAEIPSIMTDIFKEMMQVDKEIDVIPLDEACAGINGKYVSYYSKIYRIENCRKRVINSDAFFSNNKKNKKPPIKFIELTSEQWLSIPDGKPFN